MFRRLDLEWRVVEADHREHRLNAAVTLQHGGLVAKGLGVDRLGIEHAQKPAVKRGPEAGTGTILSQVV